MAGLDPRLQAALDALFAAAPPEMGLGIGSGYRSVDHQAQLWEEALRKYGSPEAARRWVAPPGKSQHNFGMAADLSYGSPDATQWVHDNAAQYGLTFPLDNENWHIELVGGRDGTMQPVRVAGPAPSGGSPAIGSPQMPPIGPQNPFEGMGLISKFAASKGIEQSADAAPLVNLWNILAQKKSPRLASLAAQQGGLWKILGA